MPTLEDVKNFFRTLILGGFEDSWRESTAGTIARGVIGVISGIDQILDIQDTIALMHQFHKKNWQLNQDDYANLAFTALGWFPSLGSPIKAALKPLWKNRRNAARGVQNGVAMIERALGRKYGGFIRNIKNYVNNVQKWNQGINSAIYEMRKILNNYLQVLHFIAKGSITFRPIESWKWSYTVYFPNNIVNLAKQQIPVTQKFQTIMESAIRRGSETVRLFLQELLGEHASSVATAIAGAANRTTTGRNNQPNPVARANQPATNKRQSNKPQGETNHPQLKQQRGNAQSVGSNQGRAAFAVQRTGVYLTGNPLTGIVGEHMADYWMWQKLGGNMREHDHGKQSKTSDGCYKLNAGNRLYQLHQQSPNAKGIDSLWYVKNKIAGKPYCIVEAKASATALRRSLGALLTDGRDKTERRTTQNQHQLQMSHEWCKERLNSLGYVRIARNASLYSRYVVFFNSSAIKDHLSAYDEIMSTNSHEIPKTLMEKHKKHEPTAIFDDVKIDTWVATRTSNRTTRSTTRRPRNKHQ
ncbi:hypothetical protein MIS46_06235 [Wielerella bovis]|uniref:hypothetical protein n=1 Tax=Wielerella bovis TaxID=2917790 RepID=UPI002018BE98|nr:hypothetical protein [Wielerella bovis]ULJ61609.1 hypothetical protein MIS46_06235 [Wielerella bovis]